MSKMPRFTAEEETLVNRKIRYNPFFYICLLLVGVLICGISQSALAGDDIDALKATSDALLKVKSYRVHTTTLSQGKTSTGTIEVVAPNRMHIIDERMEMIVVPEGTYQKSADCKWEQSPIDMSTFIAKARTPEFISSMLKDTQVHLIGPDTLDGKSMMVYEVITVLSPDMKNTSQVWISTSDHLLYKAETEVSESKITSIYTDYNAPINIVSPTQ